MTYTQVALAPMALGLLALLLGWLLGWILSSPLPVEPSEATEATEATEAPGTPRTGGVDLLVTLVLLLIIHVRRCSLSLSLSRETGQAQALNPHWTAIRAQHTTARAPPKLGGFTQWGLCT